jgi:flagellar FliL protein
MAEVAQQEAEAISQQDGGTNKLLIIISAILFLTLIAGGVVTYTMLNSDDEVIEDVSSAKTSEILADKKTQTNDEIARDNDFTQIGPMYSLDKFIVNLSSDGGSRYLRTAINLELSSEEFQAEVDKKKPMIRDIIIRVLSAKSYEEISTIRGKRELKDEIVAELNKIFTDGRVENIFFTEFVVQ